MRPCARTSATAARHAGRFALALLLCRPAPAAALGQGPPVFRAEARLVLLRATVSNRRGELVTDLERSAFTVYENGQPQTISVFRRDDVPVSLGIVIDNSRSMRDKRPGVETAALAFLRASNPQDEMFVLNFADKAEVAVPLTSDLKLLEAGLERRDSIGGTALRDAVATAEEYLDARAARDHKVLLLITDGNDNASVISKDHLKRQAERNGIVVYAVGLPNPEDPAKAERAREELEELTEPTGGKAYYPASVAQTETTVLDVAHQIRRQYTIGYAPLARALDGSYRKLRVVAKGPERLWVRTRAGYRATADKPGKPTGGG